jgi:hypothetical protein
MMKFGSANFPESGSANRRRLPANHLADPLVEHSCSAEGIGFNLVA